jgi:excisionase family DNA binding protein
MPLTETIVPTDDEQETARHFSRILSRGGDIKLVAGSAPPRNIARDRSRGLAPVAEEIVLAHARIAHMVQTLLEQLAQGKAVTIVPNDALLTTQDAADLLQVSRPYLIKLLAKEQVPVQKVGNRRKIAFEAIKKLQQKLQAESEQALRELAKLDSELNLSD